MSSSRARRVAVSIASTRSRVGGTTGKPSVTPLSNQTSKSIVMGAPKWPPNPQRLERHGAAVALLDHGRRGPRNGPQTPNAWSATAQPWRSSITVVLGPEMAPHPQRLGRHGAALGLLH